MMKQSIKKMENKSFIYEKVQHILIQVFDDDENIQYSWKKSSRTYFDDDIWKLDPS